MGKWVRLEVPASAVGLEGQALNGAAFTVFGGRATFDRAGKFTPAPPVTALNQQALVQVPQDGQAGHRGRLLRAIGQGQGSESVRQYHGDAQGTTEATTGQTSASNPALTRTADYAVDAWGNVIGSEASGGVGSTGGGAGSSATVAAEPFVFAGGVKPRLSTASLLLSVSTNLSRRFRAAWPSSPLCHAFPRGLAPVTLRARPRKRNEITYPFSSPHVASEQQ